MTRPAPVYLLLLLLLFQGLSGLAGGLGLVLDPTGVALGIDAALLDGSPFPDYRIPGLFLLGVLGGVPLGVAALVARGNPWAWSASLMVGLTLLAWLYVEILVVGYLSSPPLQLVYGLVGLAVVVLTLLPSVRRDLRGSDGVAGTPDGSDGDPPTP